MKRIDSFGERFFRVFLLLLFAANAAYSQSGGDFVITQSVISGGGNQSAGSNFAVQATIGQTITGQSLTASSFAVSSGFWNFTAVTTPPPPIPLVRVGGHVLTAQGEGLKNTDVTLTYPTGQTFTFRTKKSGDYFFENVPSGFTYIISVSAKKITFGQPQQVVFISGETTNIDFVANN